MAGARVMTCEIHRQTCPVAHRSAGTGPCSRPAADLSAHLCWCHWLYGVLCGLTKGPQFGGEMKAVFVNVRAWKDLCEYDFLTCFAEQFDIKLKLTCNLSEKATFSVVASKLFG